MLAYSPNGVEVIPASGFLVRIDGQIYLVTAAHLADYGNAPTGDWSKWSDTIYLVDEAVGADGNFERFLASFDLFHEGTDGSRAPRFKFAWWQGDDPNAIMDIILLPLTADELIVEMYDIFELPRDRGNYEDSAPVTMLGRRVPGFPALSVGNHHLTTQRFLVCHMMPQAQVGESGGPVISSAGLLLGMNFGVHTEIPGAMLFSTETIESIATAENGFVEGWAPYQPEASPGPQ